MMLIKHPEDSKVFLEEIKDPGFGSLFFLGLFFLQKGTWGVEMKTVKALVEAVKRYEYFKVWYLFTFQLTG